MNATLSPEVATEPRPPVRFTPTAKPAPVAKEQGTKQRLLSLDAYRGLIMITLAFNGFGLAALAKSHLATEPGSAFWAQVFHHFEHAEWVGCGYWDLIQPSFMFMVGVSMAYSYVKRKAEGDSYGRMLWHAMWRSLVLIFLGIFLTSNGSKSTGWSFMNVLSQMGLGYTFLFLCWGRGVRVQALVVASLLVGTWLLYVTYPGAGLVVANGADAVGVTKDWAAENLAKVSPAWHKNANIGHAIDLWFLNLMPVKEAFVFNKGGYQTINFIPSLATMIFGLMCGELLRREWDDRRKLKALVLAGVAGLVLGMVLDATGICPLVKRIWTPAWALYSTGWCCLLLAGFYGVIDMAGYRKWSFPLLVVGANSIAIYCMSMTLKPWCARTLQTHFGQDVFKMFGEMNVPVVQAVMVGLMFWLACWYLYRHKIFIRI